MALTPETITQRADLAEELANIRAQKYAIDDEENEGSVRCVDAPIFDRSGRIFAAISISSPAYQFPVSGKYRPCCTVKRGRMFVRHYSGQLSRSNAATICRLNFSRPNAVCVRASGIC
ncbi:MAG: IclR family transcriptional regulator C-terminal domain-containing protein [Chloroflexota bacterium]